MKLIKHAPDWMVRLYYRNELTALGNALESYHLRGETDAANFIARNICIGFNPHDQGPSEARNRQRVISSVVRAWSFQPVYKKATNIFLNQSSPEGRRAGRVVLAVAATYDAGSSTIDWRNIIYHMVQRTALGVDNGTIGEYQSLLDRRVSAREGKNSLGIYDLTSRQLLRNMRDLHNLVGLNSQEESRILELLVAVEQRHHRDLGPASPIKSGATIRDYARERFNAALKAPGF